ncbi:MAG TPA: hypothetical protein VFR23_25545 [Jiangellaceae bacterium]|nr:hypothetical protein [Jiangellaceae bacterium]
MSAEPVRVETLELVGKLMSASIGMTHDVTSQVIDSLTEQLADAHAREAAVQEGVLRLLSGPWMPTPEAIRRALLVPDKALIAKFREASPS